MSDATYDRIGVGYGAHRRGDPRIAARICDALQQRHGHLREESELDVGLRLVIAKADGR